MIYEVDVYKNADGKLYVMADDEDDVWDYLANTEINDEDVVWDKNPEVNFFNDYETVRRVVKDENGKIKEFMYFIDKEEDYDDEDFISKGEKVPIIDLSRDFDSEPMYMNECKNDDGCGGCPYYDNCALTQRGAWY